MRGKASAAGRPWSIDDLAYVHATYESKTHAEIGEALGRGERAVRNLCWKRGWRKLPGWSDEEIGRLRKAYASSEGPVCLDDLAKSLGRLKSNVCRKARELGLERSRTRRRRDGFGAEASSRMKRWHTEHEHPRGALGMHHTPKVRAVLSAKGRASWADPLSGHNSKQRAQKMSDSWHARSMSGAVRKHMYSRCAHGKRSDLDGRYFRSSWEANYARYLNWLIARKGCVVSWEYESRTFEFAPIKRGTRSYTPDFRVVFADGHHEWHEVKGWMDPKSVTRLARFARYYPAEKLVVIGAAFFKALKRQGVPALIPHWEHVARRDLGRAA